MTNETTSNIARRFASPYQNLIGYEIFQIDAGLARIRLDLQEKHLNPASMPHGGVYATLLDAALGIAGSLDAQHDTPKFAVTLSLNVNYIGRAKGNILTAEGRKVGGGKNIYFSEGEVRDEDGNIVATGTANFKFVRRD